MGQQETRRERDTTMTDPVSSKLHSARTALSTVGAALIVGIAACGAGTDKTGTPATSAAPSNKPLDSKSFVLVHGAWQGAWAWSDEANALRARGATVNVVELPGHGEDTTPIPDDTLDAYVAKTAAAIDASPRNVILVGHSLAGAVITSAVEARAARIDRVVYLAAYVPKDGEKVLDIAHSDAASHIGQVIVVDMQHGIASIPKDNLGDIFCADCSPTALSSLIAHYRDEPLPAFVTPVHSTPENWGSARKFYIFTKEDHAVSYDLQQRMTADVSWTGTATLDTSHSPFLSETDALADALTDVATR
jgi:pimeloyl-ACP methyl ester carboxylesterase